MLKYKYLNSMGRFMLYSLMIVPIFVAALLGKLLSKLKL